MSLNFIMLAGRCFGCARRRRGRLLLLAIMILTCWSSSVDRSPAQLEAAGQAPTSDDRPESTASHCPSTHVRGFVELRIPLEDGRYYRTKDFLEELERKLPGKVSTAQVGDRKCELDLATRAALEALHLAYPDAFQYRLEQRQMVLRTKQQQEGEPLPQFWQKLWGGLIPAPPQGLQLPKSYDPSLRTALLVHGLESSSADLRAMSEALQEESVQVLLFDYPNDGPIRDAGRLLREELLDLSRERPRARVAIIAHSMGGLVARYALESTSPSPTCVTDLFLVATPNEGSRLGIGQEWLEFAQSMQGLTAWRFGDPLPGSTDDGRGEAAADLMPGSRCLRELAGFDRPRGVRYHVAAGRRGFLDEDAQRALVEGVGADLRRRGVLRARREQIVAFLSAPELRHGSGDGAVTVSSATLQDAATVRVFDLNHITLIRPHNGREGYRAVLAWILNTMGWRTNHGGRDDDS